jgi:hypothetical protein
MLVILKYIMGESCQFLGNMLKNSHLLSEAHYEKNEDYLHDRPEQ